MPLNIMYKKLAKFFEEIIMYKENAGSRFKKSQTGKNKFRFLKVLFLYFSEVQKEKIETHTHGQIETRCQF